MTPQQAVDQVPVGGRIELCPGHYNQDVCIRRCVRVYSLAGDIVLASVTIKQTHNTEAARAGDPQAQDDEKEQPLEDDYSSFPQIVGVTIRNLTIQSGVLVHKCSVVGGGLVVKSGKRQVSHSLHASHSLRALACQLCLPVSS